MPLGRVILWVATLAGLGLLARTFLVGPVPLWIAATALVAYCLLSVAGVLIPQLEMYGDVLWRGKRGAKGVALTFDDGPHPTTTRRILELLARHEAKATFFVVGIKAERYPDVVREIVEAGHDLGVHGYHHDRLYSLKPPSAVSRDIQRAQDAIEAAAGVRPTWFRPPIGFVSPRTAVGAKRAGVDLVAWSVRSLDGVRREPWRVSRRVVQRLRPGAIILFHDASEREDFVPASIEALPRVLEAMRDLGLQPMRLASLV